MHTPRALTLASALLALMTLGLPAAFAGGITYTISGTGSGFLGSLPFTNAAFRIVSTADTAAVTNIDPVVGIFANPDITSSVTVNGLGTGVFTFNTTEVVNQGGGPIGQTPDVGISDFGRDLAILFVNNNQFASYDLSTPIGPVSGSTLFNSGAKFGTTRGDFSLTAANRAVFAATPSAVPEPSSLAAYGLGALGLGVLLLRARRKKAAHAA